jgi:hypothetical protein
MRQLDDDIDSQENRENKAWAGDNDLSVDQIAQYYDALYTDLQLQLHNL